MFVICFLFCMLNCHAPCKTLTTVPVLLKYVLYYPDHALERGLEGTVTVIASIDETGKVDQIGLHQTSGFAILDSAALRTGQTFRFAPAMLNGRPVKAIVTISVEFRLREIDLDTWITEVKVLQKRIEKGVSEENVESLHQLYKKLIYSTRYDYSDDLNDYVSIAVLKSTAKIWDGYWDLYPAVSLLFIDIMKRYPDTFVKFHARADFKKYLQEEAIRIHQTLPDEKPYTLINRLYCVLEEE
jgi:TonB family protein